MIGVDREVAAVTLPQPNDPSCTLQHCHVNQAVSVIENDSSGGRLMPYSLAFDLHRGDADGVPSG